MSATNRFANRLLLAIAGLVLLLGAAAVVVLGARPEWAAPVTDRLDAGIAAAQQWLDARALTFGSLGSIPAAAAIGAAVALLLAIVLIVFLSTRGGGATRTVARIEGAEGLTAVDASVVEAVLAAPLRDRRDVLAASIRLSRVGGAPCIRLALTPRRGADLAALLAVVEGAIGDWDIMLGRDVPVVVHCKDRGIIASRRSPNRAQ